jgi:hypothetical protein
MPTNVTSTSNYNGKAAGRIIGAAFKEADTISKGLISTLENVNYKENLQRIRYTDGTVAYSCGFTPSGAIVLNERVIEPVKLKNDLQVCKETFRNQWGESIMGGSASNPMLGGDISQAILTEVLSSTAERTDDVIWNGDSANTNEWDGFSTLFAADAAVIKPTPAGAVTKANVLTAFQLVENNIPTALLRKNLIWAVSPDVATKWAQYLIENGLTNGFGGNANTALVYGRYNISIINGLADNTIVVYQKENLVFATGLLGDHNSIAVVDEDEIGLLTGMVRMKMVYNGGVNYYNSEDIVYYVGA